MGRKGLESINAFSIKHNEINPENPIPLFEFDRNKKVYVHESCRKQHTNARRLDQKRKLKREDDMDSFNKRAKLRSEKQRFSFREDCFICGKNVDKDLAKRLPGNPDYQYSIVMTISLIETVAKRCEERRNSGEGDTWADKVIKRVACTNNPPAEEAIYHRKCFQYFMTPSKALTNKTDDPEAVAALPAQLINRIVKHLGTSLSISKITMMKLSLLMSSMQLWKVRSAVRVCIPKKHCSGCCTSTMAIKSLLLRLSSSP